MGSSKRGRNNFQPLPLKTNHGSPMAKEGEHVDSGCGAEKNVDVVLSCATQSPLPLIEEGDEEDEGKTIGDTFDGGCGGNVQNE
ncbi:hypothetical protein LIER_39797 [Lithospermum erythrorhizon]|uniref:Uncharacterized protein n=1 Tax=Lithospermum erythrorhizon TaxID=34254 RepID=A0AAV3QK81_LITER